MNEQLKAVIERAHRDGWKIEPSPLRDGSPGFVLKSPTGDVAFLGATAEWTWNKAWNKNLLPTSAPGIKQIVK